MNTRWCKGGDTSWSNEAGPGGKAPKILFAVFIIFQSYNNLYVQGHVIDDNLALYNIILAQMINNKCLMALYMVLGKPDDF